MAGSGTNDGLYRVGAQYGEVLRDGVVLAELTAIEATVEVGVIDVNIVGSTATGAKPGRETREGTFTIQKIDSRWENEVHDFISLTVQQRRQRRRQGRPVLRPFQMQISLDDPDALGYEVWQLNGCLIFRMTMGFDIGDELLTREIPFRWFSEERLADFTRTGGTDPDTGLPKVRQRDIRGR